MPLPTGVTTVTVTGRWAHADGTPATGAVSFLPVVPVLDPAGPAVLPSVPTTVPLDGTGAISTALAATDDTGTSPTGWTYTVVETIDGRVRPSYSIEVPKASAPTVDLASLTPAVPVGGVISYATTSQLAAKVQKSGDTMTGPLILAADPTTALGAATKQYVDTATGGGPFLPLAGGALSGPLTVASVRGSTASGGTLTLNSTSNATKGSILIGANSAYDQVNDRLGINTTSPSTRLHIASAISETMVTVANTNGSLGTGGLVKVSSAVVANSLLMGLNADTVPRYNVRTDGLTEWGAGGSTARDTNLYRNAAAELKSDQSLTLAKNLTVGGSQLLAGGVGVLGLVNAATPPSSTPAGGAVVYAANGGLFVRDAGGASIGLVDGPPAGAPPTGAIAETIPRWAASATTNVKTGGTLYLSAVWLQAGQTVNNISLISGATAASGPTHWWFALIDRNMTLRGHTADQTSGAIAANTLFTKALVTPYVATYSGLHYVGVMVTASTTMPTWLESGIAMANQSVASPPQAGPSSTGLTTPGTDGTTSYAAVTQNSGFAAIYSYLS